MMRNGFSQFAKSGKGMIVVILLYLLESFVFVLNGDAGGSRNTTPALFIATVLLTGASGLVQCLYLCLLHRTEGWSVSLLYVLTGILAINTEIMFVLYGVALPTLLLTVLTAVLVTVFYCAARSRS